MIDTRYADAIVGAGGGRICGYRLRFLTMRHVLGLLIIDSPVIGGGGDFQDTLLACRILSTRTEAQWRRAICGGGALGGICWKARAFLAAAWYGRTWWRSAAALQGWLEGEMILPDVRSGGDGKSLKSDTTLAMVCRFSKMTGQALSRSWWERFADVGWAGLTAQELEGADFVLIDDATKARLIAQGWKEDEI